MFREITLGQYYPADSILHKLDPRTKLMGTLFYIVSLFVFNNPWGFVAITAFLVTIIVMSKVPFSYMVKGLRGIIVLMVVAGVFNIFLTTGDVIWSWGKLSITVQGLKAAALMLVRMIYLIVGTSLMTLTTTPNHLTDGLETGLKPLSKIKVPVHDIAMMMSIALRFIPILVEETDKIMKAQMARGADFESGNIFKKVKSMIPLLVPLFISAFRRANDLALAMEARCYNGGEGRTKMKPLKYASRDGIAYITMVAYLAAVIGLRFVAFPWLNI